MNKTVPAVSIIIPMYNVEKYVGECLDSILNQTFTDYEVITVDDCSTDKTCEVVESYLPRFEGKLQLIRSKKNSGGCPAIRRNQGMRLSHGEYLMFVDSDDAITKTALQELYYVAKKFDADVVNCDKYYPVSGEENVNKIDVTTLKPSTYLHTCEFVTEPTLMTNNIEKRLLDFQKRQIMWNFAGKIIRRNTVMENDLKMIGTGAEDMVFTSCLLIIAKNYVRVPNVVYFYRQLENSLVHQRNDAVKTTQKWIKMFADAINYLENFFTKNNIFTDNSQVRYMLYDTFMVDFIKNLMPVYAQIPAHLLDEFVRRELSEFDDTTAITAFLFARMNILNVQLIQAQNLLRQQPKEVQDFQRQNEIIQRQQAQIQQLQQQLRNVHDIFR